MNNFKYVFMIVVILMAIVTKSHSIPVAKVPAEVDDLETAGSHGYGYGYPYGGGFYGGYFPYYGGSYGYGYGYPYYGFGHGLYGYGW